MLVSIVIPCYNSEHSIKKTVELTVEEFKKSVFPHPTVGEIFHETLFA